MSRGLTGALALLALGLFADDLRLRGENEELRSALTISRFAEERSQHMLTRTGPAEQPVTASGQAAPERGADEPGDEPGDEATEAGARGDAEQEEQRAAWEDERAEKLRGELEVFIEEQALDEETGEELILLVEDSADDMMAVWSEARAGGGARPGLGEELEAIIEGLEEDVEVLLGEERAATFRERFGGSFSRR